MLDKLKKHLESEEGQRHMSEWAERHVREEAMHASQLERFHTRFGGRFHEIVDRVEAKYRSPKYRESWYGRGIEPPESLFFFLFDYAEKHGRECSDEEWEKYGNMFTGALFYIHGFYFNKMNGQGTVVQIERES